MVLCCAALFGAPAYFMLKHGNFEHGSVKGDTPEKVVLKMKTISGARKNHIIACSNVKIDITAQKKLMFRLKGAPHLGAGSHLTVAIAYTKPGDKKWHNAISPSFKLNNKEYKSYTLGFDTEFKLPDSIYTLRQIKFVINGAGLPAGTDMEINIDNILVGELSGVQDYILHRKRYSSLPLVSCFINDCLALGKDAANDGARYSYIYPCFPGFINLIDSVVAIRRVVYEEKRATLEEIADAIKGNFEGEERLRAFLLNRCAKFGNDLDESDEIAKDLFEYMNEELKKFNTCVRNGSFHPSYFAWIQHGVLGQKSAATPDGRLCGEALSECLGSVQGMDKNGPIALMHSTSKIPQHHAIGGVATNFRFSKRMMRESLPEIKAFIKEFMKNGNFEAQFNVVDQETLLDALERPAYHKTLMVRVAGYSDYFVDLSPIIQREIISRLEHGEL